MIYWLILLSILIINFRFKKESIFFLWVGVCLFCIGAVVSIVSLQPLAEFIMRISLIYLLIGFLMVLRESAL